MHDMPFCSDAPGAVAYDAYFEPCGEFLKNALRVRGSVTVDLYGTKPRSLLREHDYFLSTARVRGRSPAAVYPLAYRPIELNLLFGTAPQSDAAIYLYPSSVASDEARFFRPRQEFEYRTGFSNIWRSVSAAVRADWIGLTLLGVSKVLGFAGQKLRSLGADVMRRA